jgi:hypothetical protein
LLAFGHPQVERNRLFVAGHHRPPQRLPVHQFAAPLADRVAGPGQFHLDHFRAHVAEQLPAEGPGQQHPQFNHPDAGKRSVRQLCVCFVHVNSLVVGRCSMLRTSTFDIPCSTFDVQIFNNE